MCDFSRKLIAWLDRELPEDESADVERHVRACTECRSHLEAYEQVSSTFNAYCDAAMASKVGHSLPRWVPVLSGAVAAAALLLIFSRAPVEKLPVHPPVAAPPAIVLETAPAPIKRIHPRHALAPAQNQTLDWAPAEPAIQIAIPAEAMFPPGAIPEGVNFIADVSIAADGSAQRLRLRPRLIGFERRSMHP
jgi:anti-sigma factor RsiW